jgi:hypothetical protein
MPLVAIASDEIQETFEVDPRLLQDIDNVERLTGR